MNLEKIKVGKRLGLGFALVLLLLIVVTLLGISRMAQIQDRLEKIVNVSNVETRTIIDMRAIVFDRLVSLRNLTLLTDIDDMAPDLAKIKDQSDKYAAADDKLSKMFDANPDTTSEEKSLLAKLREQQAAAASLPAKAQELGLANNPEVATITLIKKLRPIQNKWMETLDAMLSLEDKLNAGVADDAKSAFGTARLWMLLLGGLALIASIAAASLITRSLLKQLGGEPDYATQIASQIAAGDLAVVIDIKPGDERSIIAEMRHMRDSLVNIVGEVRVRTDTIATASSEIAMGNIDLSSRTEQQASSLEKTSSAMKELTNTVKLNADNAREANQLALSASEVARHGGTVVSQVVDTMSSITESAKKIEDIISVIDGIAFQTNILALNAAVEAARAGEQGRGFAVVASEVRNLAQRSAVAAKEIKGLITNSVEKVEIGSKLVSQAGVTINQIVSSVKQVTDIIAEISQASQDQSSDIEGINHSVIDMDSMTQQNAALVEEAAAAAQSLQDQASELAKVVSIFKLNTDSKSHTERKPAPPAARSEVKTMQVKVKPKVTNVKSLPVAKPAPKKKAVSNDNDWEEF
ncbi:methyl-accepting chemotaxis protein [Oxalobacteraceae bacterium GrIS 2.11]